MKKEIVLERGTYSLKIREKTCFLKLYRGKKLILQSGKSSPVVFIKGATRLVSKAVRCCRQRKDVLEIEFSTNIAKYVACLAIRCSKKSVRLRWSIKNHPGRFDAITDSYNLASGGHWYGMGWVQPQYFPLETGEIEMENFWAHNVRSPFWLTSTGAGIFCNTHKTMSAYLNRKKDGLLCFGIYKNASLDYELLIGKDIREVYYEFVGKVGKPERIPEKAVFEKPIFSTWCEYDLAISQKKVLEYARNIKKHKFPYTTLEIDGNWETAYGDKIFLSQKFPSPKKMVQELHKMGFKVTLWTHPFLDLDGELYNEIKGKGYLVKDRRTNEPAVFEWWNGKTTLIDLTNPEAERWFGRDLRRLMKEYGFDGFKFDAGDAVYQPPEEIRKMYKNITLSEYTDLFMEFAAKYTYRLAEFRVHWLTQHLGILTRLGGKDSIWGLNNGLQAVIPQSLTHGLLGYPYLIPDMIIGRVRTREKAKPLPSKGLVVRWMQASILMPIPQYSYAPWHYDKETIKLCREYSELHADLVDYIYGLAREAHRKGTPMMRTLFFEYPEDKKSYPVKDEFLLGKEILVAPMVEKGKKRDIYLPPDEWRDVWKNKTISGERWLRNYPVPLYKLPIFVRESETSDKLVRVIRKRILPLTK